MGVDKTLQVVYDLASLNEEQAGELVKANEQIIKKAEDQKKKKKKKPSQKKSDLPQDANQQVKDFEKFQKKKEQE